MSGETNKLVKYAKHFSKNPARAEMDMLLSSGERVTASLLSIALQEMGFDATAMSGRKAGIVTDSHHTKARIEEIDDPSKIGLIITDIEMPGTDGYQVAQIIKENAELRHIPIVVNSSMTTSAVKHKMKSIGVDDFIGKTDIKSLYNVVVKYIGLT